MCRLGLARNAVRVAAGERNGKRSGKNETEGSGPGPPSIVWVLGYDQRLRTESDVFVQPNFLSAHRCGFGSWSRSGRGSRHRGVANRVICHASSSVPPTGRDSNPPWRENSVTGQAPRTIRCDASRRRKQQIIYARPRSDAIVRHPKQLDTAHMSMDYPRGSNWVKRRLMF